MLKEIADKAVSEIGPSGRSTFRLLDAVQRKLEERSLYCDVLPDAACLCTEQPKALFIEQWTQELERLAPKAFGLQQAGAM